MSTLTSLAVLGQKIFDEERDLRLDGPGPEEPFDEVVEEGWNG